MVAIAVSSVLLVGMGGALTMTIGAAEKGDGPNARLGQAAEAIDQMMADMQTATGMDTDTANRVVLTVPDRTGDGNAEQITYAWTTGASGQLTRAIGGGTARVLIPRVSAMAVAWLSGPGRATGEGAEQLLGTVDTVVGAATKTVNIDTNHPTGQYLKPAFADNVVAWKITRVRVRVYQSGSVTGALRVSLVAPNQWAPTGMVITFVDLSEAALPAVSGWLDVPLATPNLAPDQGVFIKLESSGSGTAATAEYLDGGAAAVMPLNTFITFSGNAGSTWTAPDGGKDLRYYAWGTVTTAP
jgi:hypothetical protein